MKKLILCILAVLTLGLSGCKKEEDPGLSGTVWEQNIGNGLAFTFTFSPIQAVLSLAGHEEFYTYEYTPPTTVMMYPESAEKAPLKGIISGNTMSIINLSTQKSIGIFTKRE